MMRALVFTFSLTLTAFATCASASPASTPNVAGRVTASPTCPVERRDHPCPPAPVSATVQARNTSGGVVASTHTDSTGHYGLRLRAGPYTLVAVTKSKYPRCAPAKVTVRANHTTRAPISCDSGIR